MKQKQTSNQNELKKNQQETTKNSHEVNQIPTLKTATSTESKKVSPSSFTPSSTSSSSSSKQGTPPVKLMNGPPKEFSLFQKLDSEIIGFSSLPDQLLKRSVKKGFDFTVMVVGESGIGKSTLINNIYKNSQNYQIHEEKKTLHLEKKSVEMEEGGVKVRLTIIDTPGFGSSLNSKEDIKQIEDYLSIQLENYFNDERGVQRSNIVDSRVHACLYILNPSNKKLKPGDIELIRRIGDKANVVLIIGKADTLTKSELKETKNMIRESVKKYNLDIYQLPDADSDEDEDGEYKKSFQILKQSYPFAVIGGNSIMEINGKKLLSRPYPWGLIEVENPRHSELPLLKHFLLNSHVHDLIERTKEIKYENFRTKKLTSLEKASSNPKVLDDMLKEKEEKIIEMQKLLSQMQGRLTFSKK